MSVFKPPFSSLRAAIVDLDGTMVDTLGDFERALQLAFEEMGLPAVERSVIARTVGKGSTHLLRSTLTHAGASCERLEEAWERYQRHYLIVNGQHSTLYPGVREGLEALRARGLRLVCLTNKPTAFARPLLVGKGIDGYFDHVFGGDAFERQKPDPLPIVRSCEALGCATVQTLVIGDSRNDAVAARLAGCPVVLATYGYNHGEPVQTVDADAYFDRIDDWVSAQPA